MILIGKKSGTDTLRKNIMAKVLIDINVLLDTFLNRNPLTKVLIDKLADSENELFITASMLSTLDYFLTKYNANKIEFKNKFFKRFKVVTTLGQDAVESLHYQDAEDAIMALSFKRIAEDGIIITNDKNFPSLGLKVMTPVEALKGDTIFNFQTNESIPMLDLKAEYRHMLEEIDKAVFQGVAEAKYILGPEVKVFEDKIKDYIGTKHCIGCSSGTEALVLSLRALAIKHKGSEYWDKDDYIITTPFTFTATGDAILRAGATPLFVDIDLETYNISPRLIKQALKTYQGKVKGIIPVHLYGLSCEMDEIMEIAKENNLFVVEDCAQSFGARFKGKQTGSFGDTGCFSFFPSKNLGAFGDAGAVTTNDDEIAELIRMLIKHGGKDKYNVEHIGYNARLDTLQAAILLVKFKYIDDFNERRRAVAEIYSKGLQGIDGITLPICPYPEAYHVYHQYTVRLTKGSRDATQKALKEKGIQTMVYYPYPLHKMKVFEGRSEVFGDLTNAEQASENVFSLPIEPLQSKETVMHICEQIRGLFS